MAIEYTVDIARDIEPERLMCLVEEELGLGHVRDTKSVDSRIVERAAPGFYLTALGVDSMSGEIAEEWLGFKPTRRIVFRIDKEADTRAAFLRVLRATSGVLARVPGDIALILNGEYVRIIRKGARVVAKNDPRVLDAEALDQIRVPYELGETPSPET